jgi:hypothetical protein
VSRLERGIALGFTAIRLVAIATALGPSFPFGHCPHDDKCGLPFDPRQDKRTFWELLNG